MKDKSKHAVYSKSKIDSTSSTGSFKFCENLKAKILSGFRNDGHQVVRFFQSHKNITASCLKKQCRHLKLPCTWQRKLKDRKI